MKLIDQVKHARGAGVPLLAIQTPDPAACIRMLAEGLNNGPIVAWDSIRGIRPVNEGAEDLQNNEVTNPIEFLTWCDAELPVTGIAFALNLGDYYDRNPPCIQAVWNLRDQFTGTRRTLIIVQGSIDLPPAIKDDVVVLDEPLPDADQLRAIIEKVDKAAGTCPKCLGKGRDAGIKCKKCQGKGVTGRAPLEGDKLQRSVEAVCGLPAFSAEQATAMALRKEGIDLEHLWTTKVALIQQTRGLSVYRGGETFADLGGLESIKGYLKSLMEGRRPPEVVVWLDEIEKSGLGHQGDTSGVNSEQLGEVLTYMEDHGVYGLMLLGVAGSGKSMIAKAAGAEFDRLVIRINMGAMKHELVGRSGNYLRTALKVVSAVGSDNALWIATSNSIAGLDTALRSRFTDTFFFDLPSPTERSAIWDVWLRKYEDVTGTIPEGLDDGWVGRNIQRCIDKAWRFDQPIGAVAKWIIPQGKIEKASIEKLRDEANGKYLSASEAGVYKKPKAGKRGRQVDL